MAINLPIFLLQKQKLQQESGTNADHPVSQQMSKVVRKFPQKQPVAYNAAENKPRLSKDILAGVSISFLVCNNMFHF